MAGLVNTMLVDGYRSRTSGTRSTERSVTTVVGSRSSRALLSLHENGVEAGLPVAQGRRIIQYEEAAMWF